MIPVTRLDGSALLVNVDLIQWIEHTPDTLISLANGEKLYVRESPNDLLERVLQFKRAASVGGMSTEQQDRKAAG